MSEEEQKAIETLNNVLVDLEDAENGAIISLQQNEIDSIKILLNLINNQQKEIEENQVFIDDIKDHRIVYIDTPEFEEKFISKDKIREKIKKCNDYLKEEPMNIEKIEINAKISILKELLGE